MSGRNEQLRQVTPATPVELNSTPSGAEALARARRRLRITGQVQGVGLRAFVAQLARRLDLGGFVANDRRGVLIEIEGPAGRLDDFQQALRHDAPPLARLRAIDVDALEPTPTGADDRSGASPDDLKARFMIRASDTGPEAHEAEVPPDVAICLACQTAIRDPADRHFRYVFTSCTECGPRYSIIEALPYAREHTVMRSFDLCEVCRGEFDDPRGRRHHAEPIACPACGPRLVARLAGSSVHTDPVEAAATRLADGAVVALKSFGGFQLVADATSDAAVAALRAIKGGTGKPFALLVRDLGAARDIVDPTDDETTLLASCERPVVLVTRRESPRPLPAAGVAPGRRQLGVVLPVSPLQILILDALHVRTGQALLAVTSANRRGEPVLVDGDAVCEQLGELVDLVIDHDQPVLRGAEDSVVRLDAGGPTFIRRARGYAPLPISLGASTLAQGPSILAAGGGHQNAVCLTRSGDAFLAPQGGDLAGAAAATGWRSTVDDLGTLLAVEPTCVVVDQQLDDPAAELGRALARERGMPTIEVQHQHAHIAGCLAEHGHEESVIGLALDGLGAAADGEIWGGEVLVADRIGFTRAGHLERVPLAGGDASRPDPWRMAVSHLIAAYGDVFRRLPLALFENIEPDLVEGAVRDAKAGVVPTSSAGLLFDAVAALLGICFHNRFECDAAMALESVLGDLAGPGDETYGVRITPQDEGLELCTEPLVRGVVVDLIRGLQPEVISLRFHRSLAALFAAACECVWKRTGIYTVALGGSVFQNDYLTSELTRRLKRLGFSVLRPQLLPPGDGGLAYGQAVVATARLAADQPTTD